MSFATLKRPRLKRREQTPAQPEEEEQPSKGGVPRLSPAAEELLSLVPHSRPTHVPTDLTHYQVAQMAAIGLTHEEIIAVLGLRTRETLYKYYRQDLDHGKALCTAKVATRLFKVATEAEGRESVTAMIFWLKARSGWKDNVSMEVSGPDGSPIAVETLTLSHEERATRVLQLLNAGAAKGD